MAGRIMIQGTMSSAGKSLLVTALCRIFRQDGYRVAPFKSQNMALNSYVTADGLEIGRAQAVQAQAAGVPERIEMNPILLKPTGEMSSQVMVMGKSVGVMGAAEYHEYKKELIPVVRQAFEVLDSEYDIVVIEGAGSCSEINLRENDIVNMGLARLIDAPVLIAGDIDRGGVFAQLLGSVEWLEPEDLRLLRGFIINKFRGDVSLLEPGVRMLEERTHYPVFGVVPYVRVDIDDEDSLSPRLHTSGKQGSGSVDLAVIRLPMISNFTDFNIFEKLDGVRLRYVASPKELGEPDIVFLPGSKNSVGDMIWLRESGLAARIREYAGTGGIVFGICGGYQMLGKSISDPHHEEHGGSVKGLGLLEMDTVIGKEKVTRRVRGQVAEVNGALGALSGLDFTGYEIHMGVSTHVLKPLVRLEAVGRNTADVGSDISCAEAAGTAASISEPDRTGASNTEVKETDVSFTEIDKSANSCTESESTTASLYETVADGAFCDNIYGTYVHGIFDRIAPALVRALRGRKKNRAVSTGSARDEYGNVTSSIFPGTYDRASDKEEAVFDLAKYRDSQYDILASAVRKSLDMDKIRSIIFDA